MKPSASNVGSSSEQEEPLNAVELIQAGLELEPDSVQDQRDVGEPLRVQGQRGVGEESVEADSEEATQQPTQTSLGLDSFSFQDIERGTIDQGRNRVAVQPATQPGSGLESPSFQEPPNSEEEEDPIIAEILQAITRRMNILRNDRRRRDSLRNDGHRNNPRDDCHMNPSNILEEEEIDIIKETLQGNLGKEWLTNKQRADRSMNDLRQYGASHREENDNLIGVVKQGTAWQNRLQVPSICGAKLRSEPECVSTASIERTYMHGVSSEEEAKVNLLCEDARRSSASATVQEEGNTTVLECTETELDDLAVAQQASYDVSESSSNSLVSLLLGFLRDAFIVVYLAIGDCRNPCSSGPGQCFFWIATLTLIIICFFRRLIKTIITCL